MSTPTVMNTLTSEKAIELLGKAAEAYGPDWVDPLSWEDGCQNVYQDNDGNTRYCIAAWVLKEFFGVHDESLSLDNRVSIRRTLDCLNLRDYLEPGALMILEWAQTMQDDGESWGKVAQLAASTNKASLEES